MHMDWLPTLYNVIPSYISWNLLFFFWWCRRFPVTREWLKNWKQSLIVDADEVWDDDDRPSVGHMSSSKDNDVEGTNITYQPP